MEEKKTTVTGSVVDSASEPTPVSDGWVAPEVAAAESGEQVDFGKHLDVEES